MNKGKQKLVEKRVTAASMKELKKLVGDIPGFTNLGVFRLNKLELVEKIQIPIIIHKPKKNLKYKE